jgi:hypothetical protein
MKNKRGYLEGITLNGQRLSAPIISEIAPSEEFLECKEEQKKHCLYRKPVFTTRLDRKRGPIMQYDSSQTFDYILRQIDSAKKSEYDKIQGAKQRMIRENFEVYRRIPKSGTHLFKDLCKDALSTLTGDIRSRIKMLEQSGVIETENVTEKNHKKTLITVLEQDENEALCRMIENVDLMLGYRKPTAKVTKDDVEIEPIVEVIEEQEDQVSEAQDTDAEFEAFKQSYASFKSLFPNLTFNDFLKTYMQNKTKEM